MCAFDSRLIDTVDEVLKVGRRMAVAELSFLSVSKTSFELSSTAVGGGTRSGAGKESLSGVRTLTGVLTKEDPDDGLWWPGRLRRFSAASSAASDREIAEGFFRAVLKVKRAREPKVARVSSSFSRRPLITWRGPMGSAVGFS